MYLPNPLRCMICLKFGHHSDSCRNKKHPICALCAKPRHQEIPCEDNNLKCVNCEGPHSSFDVNCPKFQEEKRIKEIQFKQKVTYGVAKKLFRENNSLIPNATYASVTRKNRIGVEVGCQTEPFIFLDDISKNSSNSTTPLTILPKTEPSLLPPCRPPTSARSSPPPPLSLPSTSSLSLPPPVPATLPSPLPAAEQLSAANNIPYMPNTVESIPPLVIQVPQPQRTKAAQESRKNKSRGRSATRKQDEVNIT